MQQTTVTMYYDPAYRSLDYPGGDVSPDRGVCSDVIVRALRSVGADLQVLIHEDMRDHFSEYPQLWGLRKPDRNIDHRRVPNIACFLRRRGMVLPLTREAMDYRPGDIVTWKIPGNLDHVGIVADTIVQGTGRHAVIHNIGSGTRCEDILLTYPITGHYRYFGQH